MNFDTIFANNRTWVEERLRLDPEYFRRLAEGQSPEVLYIGCSDSRVSAEELIGAQPGELFVHRNIANLVPGTDLNVLSVINFAVQHLRVAHIVVCGHYECGGVKAAMQSADLGILNPWLRNIRDVYRLHKRELEAIADEAAPRYRRLVELNVQEQCVNVLKIPEVQIAYRAHRLAMHAWVFDVGTGEIIDLKLDFERVLEGIREIYHLD